MGVHIRISQFKRDGPQVGISFLRPPKTKFCANILSLVIILVPRFPSPVAPTKRKKAVCNVILFTISCVSLDNGSCNVFRNGISPFASRQVAGIVLHCAIIFATCFETATKEDY